MTNREKLQVEINKFFRKMAICQNIFIIVSVMNNIEIIVLLIDSYR